MKPQTSQSQLFLNAAAENIFPSYKKLNQNKTTIVERVKQASNIPVEISSYLPLQILMTCTVWLYPVWVITTLNGLVLKVSYYGVVDFHRFMNITLFALFTICEPIRLWLGYSGNLRESIPDLAGFFMLSCFPQFPTTIYFIGFQPISLLGYALPMDIALNIVYGSLILAQLVTSWFGGQRIVQSHAAQFLLRQYKND